jgi:hypothetical protein
MSTRVVLLRYNTDVDVVGGKDGGCEYLDTGVFAKNALAASSLIISDK